MAVFTVGLNVFGFLAVAAAERLPRGRAAPRGRTAGGGVESARRPAGVQPARHRQPDERTGHDATCDGRMLTFNRAAEAITGITAAEAVGRRRAEVLQLPRDLADAVRAARGTPAAAAGRDSRSPRGRYGTIELGSARRCSTRRAARPGSSSRFQDVTESRKHEREARVQQRLAAVGEMAAGIAHEIRNPLASMSGSIQILRQELPLTAEQSQLMDIVLRESDRLNETIRSFLAYARPQRAQRRAGGRAPGASPTRRGCCENNAELHRRRTRSRWTCRRSRSGTSPTRTRSARSSGTSRPTACARCPTAARCGCPSRGAKQRRQRAGEMVIRGRGPGRRHRAGGARRHLSAVPRRVRARHRPRPRDRPSHRQRLRRRSPRDVAARRRHHAWRSRCR